MKLSYFEGCSALRFERKDLGTTNWSIKFFALGDNKYIAYEFYISDDEEGFFSLRETSAENLIISEPRDFILNDAKLNVDLTVTESVNRFDKITISGRYTDILVTITYDNFEVPELIALVTKKDLI